MTADKQLKAYIDRVLRLKEEQDTLSLDIREVYAEAKAEGYDKTIMGKLVAHLRKVLKEGDGAVIEQENVFDTYLQAYHRASGTPVATHTHEEEFDPITGEFVNEAISPKLIKQVVDGMQTEVGRAALIAAVDIMIAHEEADEEFHAKASGDNGATEQDIAADCVTGDASRSSRGDDSPAANQPETANEMDREEMRGGRAVHSLPAENARKAITAEGSTSPEDGDVTHAGAGESPATEKPAASHGDAGHHSLDRVSPQATSATTGSVGAHAGGDHVTAQSSTAATAGALVQVAPATKRLRPHCRTPGDNCGGYGSTHCASCLRAAREAEVAA